LRPFSGLLSKQLAALMSLNIGPVPASRAG
jgi:hypothetical protein